VCDPGVTGKRRVSRGYKPSGVLATGRVFSKKAASVVVLHLSPKIWGPKIIKPGAFNLPQGGFIYRGQQHPRGKISRGAQQVATHG